MWRLCPFDVASGITRVQIGTTSLEQPASEPIPRYRNLLTCCLASWALVQTLPETERCKESWPKRSTAGVSLDTTCREMGAIKNCSDISKHPSGKGANRHSLCTQPRRRRMHELPSTAILQLFIHSCGAISLASSFRGRACQSHLGCLLTSRTMVRPGRRSVSYHNHPFFLGCSGCMGWAVVLWVPIRSSGPPLR